MMSNALIPRFGLPLVAACGLVALPAVSTADDASDKGGLWSFSEKNYSKWSGLSPEANAQRARLAELRRRLDAAKARPVAQSRRRALARVERELRAVGENLRRLDDAPWEKRAALEARVANGLRLARLQLDDLEADRARPNARITGRVAFPGCATPQDLEICAAPSPDADPVACTQAELVGPDQRFTLAVPAGQYVVFARSAQVQPDFRAYYTYAVDCGLRVNCTDHSPVVVAVDAGETFGGVRPADWFAPEVTQATARLSAR